MENLDYILVTLDGEEPIEFECEEDGSFLLQSGYCHPITGGDYGH